MRKRRELPAIPFPLPQEPDLRIYATILHAAPRAVRFLVRVTAFLTGRRALDIMRERRLNELRERLLATGTRYVAGSPAVLTELFVKQYRDLLRAGNQLADSLQRVLGPGRFGFLRHVLAEREPQLFQQIEAAESLPVELAQDYALSAGQCVQTVQQRLSTQLNGNRQEIVAAIDGVWLALRAADLVSKLDPAAFEPGPVELTTVKVPLVQLYQVCDLIARTADVGALLLVAGYVGNSRAGAEPAAQHFIRTVHALRQGVPLYEMIQLAYGHSEIDVPRVTLRSNWWQSYLQQAFDRVALGVPATLFETRHAAADALMRERFGEGVVMRALVPMELYRSAVSLLLTLARNEIFLSQRRALSQLVIDARFFRLDLRSQLHQALLELDQALDRLRTLFDEEGPPGSYFEEAERIRRHSASRAVADRQTLALVTRFRPRARTFLDAGVTALEVIGGIVAGNSTVGADFELHGAARKSAVLSQQLIAVGDGWPRMAVILKAVVRIEAERTRPGVSAAADEAELKVE